MKMGPRDVSLLDRGPYVGDRHRGHLLHHWALQAGGTSGDEWIEEQCGGGYG